MVVPMFKVTILVEPQATFKDVGHFQLCLWRQNKVRRNMMFPK